MPDSLLSWSPSSTPPVADVWRQAQAKMNTMGKSPQPSQGASWPNLGMDDINDAMEKWEASQSKTTAQPPALPGSDKTEKTVDSFGNRLSKVFDGVLDKLGKWAQGAFLGIKPTEPPPLSVTMKPSALLGGAPDIPKINQMVGGAQPTPALPTEQEQPQLKVGPAPMDAGLCACFCDCLKTTMSQLGQGTGAPTPVTQKEKPEKLPAMPQDKSRSWTQIGQDALGMRLPGGGLQSIGSIGGNLFEGLSKVAGLLGPAGVVVGPLAKFGEFLFRSTDILRSWNDKLHQTDMRFAEFSASMTQVMMERMMRDIRLSHEIGESTAATARRREEASFRFEKLTAPAEVAWQNMKNNITSVLYEVSNYQLTRMAELAADGMERLGINPEFVTLLRRWARGQIGDEGISMGEFMDQVAKDHWGANWQLPGRFEGPD